MLSKENKISEKIDDFSNSLEQVDLSTFFSLLLLFLKLLPFLYFSMSIFT